MGQMMMEETLGCTIEAPAARAYAVLPVGVATIIPTYNNERDILNYKDTKHTNTVFILSFQYRHINDRVFLLPSPCTVVISLWLQKISMLVRKGDGPLSTTTSFITCRTGRMYIRTYACIHY